MGITVADYVAAMRRGLTSTLLQVIEPTQGPWANQNTFGDQRSQPLPVAEGQVIQVLAKLSRMYGPPAVHSVQLARGDEILAGNADIRARVTYGCGGVNNQFFCDWLHGAQFALVCNSISVDAVTYRPSGLSAYDANQAATFIAASVCKGTTTQGRCPLTFTETSIQLQATPAAGHTAVFNVRDFVREVTVHVHVAGGPTGGNSDPTVPTGVTLEFLNQGGAQLAFYDAQVCAGGRSIPIPGGATSLLVTNTNATQSPCVVEWFLGL